MFVVPLCGKSGYACRQRGAADGDQSALAHANLRWRYFTIAAGVAMFVLAVLLGGVILLVFLALATAVAAAFGVRLWWWRRQIRKSGDPNVELAMRARTRPSQRTTVDGEYRVVDEARALSQPEAVMLPRCGL